MTAPFDKAPGPLAEPVQANSRHPRLLANWLERHRHPVSFWLHMAGIPMTLAALVLGGVQLAAWRWDLWYRPAALFVTGYALQWVGHLIEGNDMGEVVLIKKWLGREYVAIAPNRRNPANPSQ